MRKTRLHYFTDNECGGVREDRPNSLAASPDEVNCSDCVHLMYDQGVLYEPTA